ncbi:glycoside hydrolase superfamily [Aspergillus egyptiacus]|nr:glycoside hydrolase superfamily [Aspergillus egyptiacus]
MFPEKSPTGWRAWSAKKKALLLGAILFVVALAIGLGVGLGLGLSQGDEGDDSDDTGDDTKPGENIWQPAVGTSWQIVLRHALNDTSPDVEVYDIDLFDNDKETIEELHALGRKVICYFSAGTYEDWREDAAEFSEDDIGDDLDEWEGESWIDPNSETIREIMRSRLDMAVQKGCDGVDPDNVDGYDNDNGLGLTEEDSVEYMRFLAKEARERNLAIGLKNAGAIIPRVIGEMQWSVNEQCAQYNECDVYAAFIKVGKPVFHIEYPKGAETNNEVTVLGERKAEACQFTDSSEFSTLIKNMDLDNWFQTC